ncbi:hypothetical protein IPM19_04785 [bacterium]|nr:MAG: hypothetical protein IPM19_04785 [bacterium]
MQNSKWIGAADPPRKNGPYLVMFGVRTDDCQCGTKIDTLELSVANFFRSDGSGHDLARMPYSRWYNVWKPTADNDITSSVAFWCEIPKLGWHYKKQPKTTGWYLVYRDRGINEPDFGILLYEQGVWCWNGDRSIPVNEEIIKWTDIPQRIDYHSNCSPEQKERYYIYDPNDWGR